MRLCVIVTLAPIAQSRPIETPGPITAAAPMRSRRRFRRAVRPRAAGSTLTPASIRAEGCTSAPGPHTRSSRTAMRPQRRRETTPAPPRRRRDRAHSSQHRQARRAWTRKPRRHQAAAGARRGELVEIFGIVEETSGRRSGRVERRNVVDAPVERIGCRGSARGERRRCPRIVSSRVGRKKSAGPPALPRVRGDEAAAAGQNRRSAAEPEPLQCGRNSASGTGSAKSNRSGPNGESQIRLAPTEARTELSSTYCMPHWPD